MEVKKEIKEMKLHGEDLHHFGLFSDSAMKDEEEIWFDTVSQHHHHHHHQTNDDDDGDNKNNINGNCSNNEMLDVVEAVVNDPSSLFYADHFPSLPEFPCMSSSSSSSSTPATTAVKPFGMSSTATSSSASSGAASWAGLKSDEDHDPSSSAEMAPPDHQQQQQQQQQESMGVVDEMGMDDVDHCMDMMQDFGCIDLLETADICWDPSPLFEDNGDAQFLQNQLDDENEDEMVFEQFMQQHQGESNYTTTNTTTVTSDIVGGQTGSGEVSAQPMSSSEDDLAMVFFEWLKSNKEAISADDLRNIKIKKSTIENAAKRLGGGKEGMKQLLKLILQWVQNHHLQNKRLTMSSSVDDDILQRVVSNDTTNNNNNNSGVTPATPSDNNTSVGGNPNCVVEQHCFSPAATWLPPPPPFANDSPVMVPPHPPPGFPPTVGYMGGVDPYSGSNPMAAYPPPPIPPSDYHSWGPTPMHFGVSPQYGGSYTDQFGGYGNPPPPAPGYYYHPGPGEGLVRLGSSATKEARKKRMARQRRFFSHHHRTSSHHNNHHNGGGVISQQMMNQMADQHAVVGNNNATCGVVAPHGNWVYWPPPPPPPPQLNHSSPMVGRQMMPPPQPQPPMERSANGFPKPVGIEKKQGWKTEKNLRFLLQKVLKQSDVGNLGRIVLPKKEAETHLPELEARDGIPIAMEDIGTSRVWNMRYRFWPNNKSRMYLLENTGDFVRSNGLQEGDFIVIYSDVKCGKYMIRGVKVRASQQGTKPETTNKKPNKAQKTEGISSPAGTPTVMRS